MGRSTLDYKRTKRVVETVTNLNEHLPRPDYF